MVTGGFHTNKKKKSSEILLAIAIMKNPVTGNYELINIKPKSLVTCKTYQLKTIFVHENSDKIIEEIGDWLEALFNGIT
jgi:hypothetical protein